MPTSAREPRSVLFDMAKVAVGGDLEGFIREQRAEGSSFAKIARIITSKGVMVSGQVVKSWADLLGLDEKAS